MNTRHIRTSHPYGEVYPNVFSDFDWIREHEKELLEHYGECTILVYEQKVIATGVTQEEAVEKAARNLPSDFAGEITPVTYYLARRHPFLRVSPK